MSDKPKEGGIKGWQWFLAIFILWLLYFLIVPVILPAASRTEIAEIAGPLEALFAGLAFAGVIIAILQQREELALQREELRLTREEMEQSTQALNDQAELNARTALLSYYAGQVARGQYMTGQEALHADQVELLKQKMEAMGLPFAGQQYAARQERNKSG